MSIELYVCSPPLPRDAVTKIVMNFSDQQQVSLMMLLILIGCYLDLFVGWEPGTDASLCLWNAW